MGFVVAAWSLGDAKKSASGRAISPAWRTAHFISALPAGEGHSFNPAINCSDLDFGATDATTLTQILNLVSHSLASYQLSIHCNFWLSKQFKDSEIWQKDTHHDGGHQAPGRS
jgi:hypothetical protein